MIEQNLQEPPRGDIVYLGCAELMYCLFSALSSNGANYVTWMIIAFILIYTAVCMSYGVVMVRRISFF